MNIGLYFGSFNPIHIGHLIIANHIVENSDLDKIWFVVSPQNPFKETASLLNEYDRLHLVDLAIKENTKFKSSNIEFHLPKPSYTIDTLTYLQEKFPNDHFHIIMGSDSYQNLPKWKNYEQIIKHYKIIVYERPNYPNISIVDSNTSFIKAPMLEISSTYIRNQIKEDKNIKYLVTAEVADYIAENRYYK